MLLFAALEALSQQSIIPKGCRPPTQLVYRGSCERVFNIELLSTCQVYRYPTLIIGSSVISFRGHYS